MITLVVLGVYLAGGWLTVFLWNYFSEELHDEPMLQLLTGFLWPLMGLFGFILLGGLLGERAKKGRSK